MKGIQRTPVEVLPDMTVVKIASGNDHLVCLTDLGEIYTIGLSVLKLSILFGFTLIWLYVCHVKLSLFFHLLCSVC